MKQYHTRLYDGKELLSEQYLVRGGTYQLCWHRAMELLVVLQGNVEAYVGGALKKLDKDDVILINPNCAHSLFIKEPETLFLVIELHPGFLKRIPEFARDKQLIDFSTDASNRNNPFVRMIRYYCAETFSHSLRGDEMEKRIARQYLGILAYELLAKFSIPGEEIPAGMDRQHEALQVAMDYIEENYDSAISLEQVAEQIKYNRTYISTLFKNSLGLPFRDYLVWVRLRHAITQLAESERSVLEVALDCGFPNANALTASMKKFCGKNPKEYREAFKTPDGKKFIALNEHNKYLSYPNAQAERLMLHYKEGCFSGNDERMDERSEDWHRVRELSEELLKISSAAKKF